MCLMDYLIILNWTFLDFKKIEENYYNLTVNFFFLDI